MNWKTDSKYLEAGERVDKLGSRMGKSKLRTKRWENDQAVEL